MLRYFILPQATIGSMLDKLIPDNDNELKIVKVKKVTLSTEKPIVYEMAEDITSHTYQLGDARKGGQFIKQ